MDRELKTECEEQSRPYQSIYSHFGPVAHCSRHQIGSLYNFLITVGTSDGMTDLKWKTFQEVFSDNPTTIQGYHRQNGLIQDPYFQPYFINTYRQPTEDNEDPDEQQDNDFPDDNVFEKFPDDPDKLWKYKSIKSHQGPLSNHDEQYMGSKIQCISGMGGRKRILPILSISMEN